MKSAGCTWWMRSPAGMACRNDPLLEPLSRVDMDWLLALLGRPPDAPVAIERARAPEPVRRTELIEGPPPSVPTIAGPASPPHGSAPAPALHESASKPAPTPAQPENAPAATPRRERPPDPPRSRAP